MPDAVAHVTDPDLLGLADQLDVPVPRGEPRRRLADVVDALVTRAPPEEVRARLVGAAEALWNDAAREHAELLLAGRAEAADAPPDTSGAAPLALAAAYRATLPLLARDQRVRGPLQELEASFAAFDDEDRDRFGPVLGRAALPALALDVELLKDEGYRFVATYPPEGSEGVDIVGRASAWLTRRMTMDGQGPRLAMRRFLAVLAEEIEIDLPATAGALDRLLAEPMPPAPARDQPFLSLAHGLVEEAIAERGFPW